ncbi:MAG: hypothetical protein LBR88_04980 [Zoogloeaceae bacterium]|nr:hypothetical protein [Zoogloeaceae bacterium]
MSGPITTGIVLSKLCLVVAAEMVRAYQEGREEYEADLEADLAEAKARAEARETRRHARRKENQARMARLHATVDRLEKKLARFSRLANEEPPNFADRRATLQGADPDAWNTYIQELEARIAALDGQLAASAEASVREALAEIGEAPEISDLLRLYLAQRQALRQEANQEAWRTTVARILARLDLPAGESLPPRLEALAQAVVLAQTPERAELLGNELRLAVQQYRAEETLRQKEVQDATAWLTLFPEDYLPAPLHAQLFEVVSGLSRLDAESRQTFAEMAARFEVEQKERENQAAAIVLEQSLLDLGYQVEAIDETLFSEGGVVHFQRAGWDEYHVRLRADTKEKTFNFNVVRSNAVEEHALRTQQDFMAEERWCSEFPKLLETLAARGIMLNVERRLEAGELPVQAVPPDRLPVFAEETRARRRAGPRARLIGSEGGQHG